MPWKDAKGKPLPVIKLHHWSDAVFLTWKSITTPEQRKGLKWILRRNMINLTTAKVISAILKKREQRHNIVYSQGLFKGKTVRKAPIWPGLVLYPGDEGFNAMLGSPNACGVCWLILQHQEDMGHKVVASVRVFDDDVKNIAYAPSMLIELKDAEVPRTIEPYEGT